MTCKIIHAPSTSQKLDSFLNAKQGYILRIYDKNKNYLDNFGNSGGYGKLDKLHIPLIEMADYMEESSLGRAEWMKFYGMLFGREKAADSLFNEVKSNYERVQLIHCSDGFGPPKLKKET